MTSHCRLKFLGNVKKRIVSRYLDTPWLFSIFTFDRSIGININHFLSANNVTKQKASFASTKIIAVVREFHIMTVSK